MTLEIIVFILSILFGIIWCWRESKSNKVYRFFNKLTHSKELQMKADNKKGFVFQQVFLLRLVWTTLVFALGLGILSAITPFNAFYIQYFVSAIVGTITGTYIASAFFFTNSKLKKENFEKVIQKGKDYVEDLTEDVKDEIKKPKIKEEIKVEEPKTSKKSARERLKDKGMIK